MPRSSIIVIAASRQRAGFATRRRSGATSANLSRLSASCTTDESSARSRARAGDLLRGARCAARENHDGAARPKRTMATPAWFNLSAAFALLVLVIWNVYPDLPLIRSNGRGGRRRNCRSCARLDGESLDRRRFLGPPHGETWFNGKIDFSPPVIDLAAQGFPLIGGRLDYVSHRAAAALIYRHDRHVINLFIWPVPANESSDAKALERNGYNLVHWTTSGMEYWAVSDLNSVDLKKFSAILMKPRRRPSRVRSTVPR